MIWGTEPEGEEREGERRGRILYLRGSWCAPMYKFNASHSNFATGDVFPSFLPDRKIAILFSSPKSPSVILKVPWCLCLRRQLAAALLKIASGGSHCTLSIKNRKGSTAVNNAWKRIPLPAPAFRRPGPAPQGRAPGH